MLLSEVMTPDVQGLNSDEPISQAARMMSDLGVGALPVFQDGSPVGIVTDRDICIRAVAEGRDCNTTPVGEVMTGEPVMLPGDTDLEDAAREMEQRQIRRVLVQGPEEQIIGICSLGDLATKCGDAETCAEVIEQISEPAEPLRA